MKLELLDKNYHFDSVMKFSLQQVNDNKILLVALLPNGDTEEILYLQATNGKVEALRKRVNGEYFIIDQAGQITFRLCSS